jgi:hypothetical protein
VGLVNLAPVREVNTEPNIFVGHREPNEMRCSQEYHAFSFWCKIVGKLFVRLYLTEGTTR